MSVIELLIEPEVFGNLCIRRIAENRMPAAHHDRDVDHADVKAIEQVLRLAIAIEIDVMKGMAVPREEFLHVKGARAMHRADDDDVAEVAAQ